MGSAISPALDDDATLDALLGGRIRVLQPRGGPRATLDALLVADFAAREGGARSRRVVDLGCGCGTVALAVAAALPRAHLVGVELQPALASLAERSAALNGLADRFCVVVGDLTRPASLSLAPGVFDLAVCNPPFHRAGRGRSGPRAERAIAHHELACTIDDVARSARRLLRSRGRLAVVFAAERLADLIIALVAVGLVPRIARMVHSVACEPARRVLVLAERDYRGGLTAPPPLVVHGDDRRSYTEEAARILGATT